MIETLMQHGTVVVVVLFGGITHALVQVKTARNEQTEFDRLDIAISFSISLFAGLMFAFGGAYFSSDTALLHGMAGLGSFLGLTGLNRIASMAMDNFSARGKS